MVILPQENHAKDLVPNIHEDSSSDTSNDSSDENEDSQHDDTTSDIASKHGFSIQEVDHNIAKFIPGNSHITVENSNDVVIGSLTQFHGPVTIVQNGDSKKIFGIGNGGFLTDFNEKDSLNIVTAADPSAPISKPVHPSGSNPSPSAAAAAFHYNPIDQFWTSKRRCLVILAAIAVPLFVIAILTTLTLNNSQATTNTTVDQIPEDNTVTLKPLGKHLQITRGQWGGRPMLNNTIPLKHPVQYVIISHTAGVWCKNFRTCSDAVQILQSLHVSNYGSPDIGHNFLIGGDANIYVGRGWDIRNFHTDNNIGISFIGNFVYDSLTPGMVEACQDLLEEGVKTGKLATNYTLIGHNQTYPTESPGGHITAVIKTWPHFVDGDFLQI